MFDLPADLAQLMHTYLGAARKAVTPASWKGVCRCSSAHPVLAELVGVRGCVPTKPSMCKQVFVDERQSHSAAAGPFNQGAAMIMGHGIKQWDKWYHMQYLPRMAPNAVDGMQFWRAAMLQSHTPAAADLTLSKALRFGHVLVSESEESQYQSCCSDSDNEVELD